MGRQAPPPPPLKGRVKAGGVVGASSLPPEASAETIPKSLGSSPGTGERGKTSGYGKGGGNGNALLPGAGLRRPDGSRRCSSLTHAG